MRRSAACLVIALSRPLFLKRLSIGVPFALAAKPYDTSGALGQISEHYWNKAIRVPPLPQPRGCHNVRRKHRHDAGVSTHRNSGIQHAPYFSMHHEPGAYRDANGSPFFWVQPSSSTFDKCKTSGFIEDLSHISNPPNTKSAFAVTFAPIQNSRGR